MEITLIKKIAIFADKCLQLTGIVRELCKFLVLVVI